MYRKQKHTKADPLARGLGWFSLALGAAELLAPRTLSRVLGMEERSGLIQAYGMREVVTGVAILASEDPAPFIWGRVAGDALDLAALAPAMNDSNLQHDNVALAIAAVAGVTLLDLLCATALSNRAQDAVPVRDYSDRSGFPNGRPSPASSGTDDQSEGHPS
ncbi:cyclase dehydrase [Terrihabitans sp. B22-R8]|uniref:cyclase dehydrase n=1 Tax=Terrihabitans sp. B22-R8 TaxID=3425128 RepID=UPI00403D3D6B